MAGDIQTQVSVAIAAAEETTYGVAAANNASDARFLRRVGSTLNTGKDAYSSAEVRVDQQIATLRHGTKRAAGNIEGELSVASYDPFLEAVMRGDWTAGVSKTQADYTSVTGAAVAGTLVLASGNPVTDGFKVGDIIRLTGAGIPAADRAVNFRINSFGGTNNRTLTVFPKPSVDFGPVATFGIAVAGKKLLNGVARRSFTMEQRYPDIDVAELFTGCRFGGAALRLPPTGMATVSFDIQGSNGVVLKDAAAPYFVSPAAQETTDVLAAVNGALRMFGTDIAVVTGLDISISLGLSSQPVVGSNFVPDIFYGVTTVTGNMSAFFKDATLIEAFINENEFDVVALFEAASGSPKDFMAFNMQRVKMSGMSKSIGADGGVIMNFPFQALKNQPAAGQPYDETTLAIQSSAAI